jgi:hypothetical protein
MPKEVNSNFCQDWEPVQEIIQVITVRQVFIGLLLCTSHLPHSFLWNKGSDIYKSILLLFLVSGFALVRNHSFFSLCILA